MAREIKIAILGDARDFARVAKSVQHDADRMGKSAARMGKAVAVGLAGAAVAGVALGKTFIDAAIESQKVTKQTEAVLKSMGDSAGVTAQQVSKLSTKLSLQTGIDDELIQSGQNLLLTFGNVRNGAKKTEKNFDRATAAALDMSVALGTDMKSASMLVGKALNDPIKGLTALRRSGIQFTDQQTKQIKAMVAVGDAAGAQRIMLKELEKQFGGSAAAQATAGEKLKVAFGNIQEELGARLLPATERFAAWLSEALPAALAIAGPVFEAIASWIGGIAPKVESFVKDALEGLSGWWTDHGDNIKTVAGEMWDTFLTAIKDVAGWLNDNLLPALGKVATWVADNKPVLKILATTVGVTLAGAFLAWAGSALVAAASSWLALVPMMLMIGTVAVLAWGTGELIKKFDLLPKAGNLINWLLDLLDKLEKVNAQLGAMIRLAKDAAGLVLKGLGSTGMGPKEAKVNPVTGKPVGKNAAGTSWWRGGLSWVGEQGPELVNLPTGSSVFSNERSMAMAGAGVTNNITINMPPGSDGQDVVEQIRRYERSNGNGWRN